MLKSVSIFVSGGGGGGTVTSVSVASANGFSGTVATATTTPAITLNTTVTGLLKGNGSAISAAVGDVDYQNPITLTTTGTSGAATFTGDTLNIPQYSGGAFSSITSGTNTAAAMVVGSGATLGVSGTGTIAATGLVSASTTVNVSSATAPSTGQALVATDSTHATWQTLTTGVSSVSNSDGTLTISPTTGAVVASLNLAKSNIWTGAPLFNLGSGAVYIGPSTPTLGAAFQFDEPTNAGPGTVAVTASGTTVTGTGTAFTSTFNPGDTITANSETHTITAIASATSMTTDAWTGTASGQTYTCVGGTKLTIRQNGRIIYGGVIGETFNRYIQINPISQNAPLNIALGVQMRVSQTTVASGNTNVAMSYATIIQANNTQNYTGSVGNGPMGCQGVVQSLAGSTGTITNGVGYNVTLSIAGMTCTNAYGYYINAITASSGGAITSAAGYCTTAMSVPTNYSHVLLGTGTIPSGTYGIYNATTLDNYFGGKLGINKSSSAGAMLHIVPTSSSTIGEIIQLAASQSVDGWELQNSSATILAKFDFSGALTLQPGVQTTGSPSQFVVTGAAHTTLTASTEAIDINWNLARTVQFATGGITTQRAALVQAPTYGFVGPSTITTATTFEISGPPVAGTNATLTNKFALRVASGNSALLGNVGVNIAPNTSYALTVGGIAGGGGGASAIYQLFRIGANNTMAWYSGDIYGGGATSSDFAFVHLTDGGKLIFSAGNTTPIVTINPNALLAVNLLTATAQLHVVAFDSTTIGQKIRLAASASVDGWQLQNSSSTVLTSFSSAGAINKYKSVTTAGWGVPAIYASGRVTAQTAAAAAFATYTVGAADGSFIVSANVLVTTSTLCNFTVTVTYTDEGNTSRVLTLQFSTLAGAFLTAIVNTGGAVPYEGAPLQIRCKASTSITFDTVGTFTTVTYNAEGTIQQVS